jgi:hypothetical protein
MRTTFTAKLGLYEKDPVTELRGTELTDAVRAKTVYVGTPLFLEADFEESNIFPGYETGFKSCYVSSDKNMATDKTALIMDMDTNKQHQYNCKHSFFEGDSRFKVHEASSQLTNTSFERLSKSLFEFPAFKVSYFSN